MTMIPSYFLFNCTRWHKSNSILCNNWIVTYAIVMGYFNASSLVNLLTAFIFHFIKLSSTGGHFSSGGQQRTVEDTWGTLRGHLRTDQLSPGDTLAIPYTVYRQIYSYRVSSWLAWGFTEKTLDWDMYLCNKNLVMLKKAEWTPAWKISFIRAYLQTEVFVNLLVLT